MKKRLLYVGALLTTVLVNAQQDPDIHRDNNSTQVEQLKEVVVTATKIPTEKKNLGKIVYQITSAMIANNQGKTVVDLLNDVPGVEINGNYSTRGQNLGYYIRGGRNRQVAILIDGINMNDPSSFSGDFDIRQIALDQIASIEVVKGAASTLYGTGAATGVINIILKKASKKRFGGSFGSHIGTNNSKEDQNTSVNNLNTNFNFNGTLKNIDYLLSLNGTQSKGLSAAESKDENVKFQEDPFNRLNALLKLGYTFNDKLRIGIFGSYDEFKTAFDEFDFVNGGYIDADNLLKNIQKRVGFTPNYKYKKGELKLNAFYTLIDRNVTPSSDHFQGEAYGFDIYNNYKFSAVFSVLTGMAVQYQDMFQKTAFSSISTGSSKQHFYDPYVSLNINTNAGFHLNTGGRLNMHNAYGNHWVYNVNPSYNFTISDQSSLKIVTSYSTAFVTPTLQEIYNKLPTIDQLNLEKDFTIEGGFDWELSDKISLNAIYFYREETDKIGFDFTTFQTINDEGTFVARGLETEVMYKPHEKLSLAINYGFVDRDESLLLKIPQHKVGMNLQYKFRHNTQASLNGKFVDATNDFGGIALASYRLLDVFINHSLIENRLTVFGSVTNLWNEDYQEIAGFSTRGRNYKLGLRLNF